MLKNRIVIVKYIITAILTSIIISYSLFLKNKDNLVNETTNFFNQNFQKKDLKNIKNIFADSCALFQDVSQEIIKVSPDSSVLKLFFNKEQSKTDGLWLIFHFIHKSIDLFSVNPSAITLENKIIRLELVYYSSKIIDLTICFVKTGNNLKISGISGLADFLMLCF